MDVKLEEWTLRVRHDWRHGRGGGVKEMALELMGRKKLWDNGGRNLWIRIVRLKLWTWEGEPKVIALCYS
jgi:hypothetical protein